MNRTVLIFMILLLIIMFVFGFFASVGPARASKTWIVDDDGPADFSAIQEAIDAASPEDIVSVKAGIYIENIAVYKGLNLVGEGAEITTIIAADSTKNVVNVTSNDVIIEGFKITGATNWYPSTSGVYINQVSNVILAHNYITNNTYGIHMRYSNNNFIESNTVFSNYFGINFEEENRYNTIRNNNVNSNTVYGIVLWLNSNNNLVTNNTITGDDTGIALGYSDLNEIVHNNLTDNSKGIEIQQISNNNIIHHNNFVNNAVQVSSILEATNVWDDGAEGNYWSDYEQKYPSATKINGIWDTPYEIDLNNIDNYPIVPEFPSSLVLPLFMIITLVAVIMYKRRIAKSC